MSGGDARWFFERAREASRDAESIRQQLLRLEANAHSLGAQGFEPRTRSTPNPHRMEGRIVAYADRERELRSRADADYEIIERATRVLFGSDEDGHGGVAQHVGTLHADVLWWRYLDDSPWKQVASVLGVSVTTCRGAADAAMRWMDETGFCAEMMRMDVYE